MEKSCSLQLHGLVKLFLLDILIKSGYVGVLTAFKKEKFAISVNFRRDENGSLMKNISKLILYKWPVGFIVRQVMIEENSYDSAVNRLATSQLAAPCYLTVCGVDDGCIITRSHDTELPRQTLKDRNCIYQTNIDWWFDKVQNKDNILWSIERIILIKKFLESKGEYIKRRDIWALYKTNPVKNEETIYISLMCPKVGYLQSRV